MIAIFENICEYDEDEFLSLDKCHDDVIWIDITLTEVRSWASDVVARMWSEH